MTDRPLIYVAGYFSKNPMHGTRNACDTAEHLRRMGYTPFIPHMSILFDIIYPQPPEFWYEYDFALLKRCDAMFVCTDEASWESTGVQNEIEFCRKHGIPVIESFHQAECWLEVWKVDNAS